jgi:hypothetical protein
MSDQRSDSEQRRVPDEYSDEEAARRRDAVVKRMLNTPPQPQKPKNRRIKGPPMTHFEICSHTSNAPVY